MSPHSLSIRLESAEDASAIDNLTQIVFGPAMLARAAYALREGVLHEMSLSFVAELGGAIIGSVRLTHIMWGSGKVLMLGPLGVLPWHKNQGAGKALMQAAVAAGRLQAQQGFAPLIVLVGDLDYYAPFGFERIPAGQISLPRPADPARILACELVEGSLSKHQGAAARLGR